LKFLTVEDLIKLHESGINLHGGEHGILDLGKLVSAVNAPISRFNYTDADIPECAATYAFHITQAHAFVDGNKRAGHYACKAFLLVNDAELQATEDELYEMYIGIASGKLNRDEVEAILRKWVIFSS
jgi:death-on-curing protein